MKCFGKGKFLVYSRQSTQLQGNYLKRVKQGYDEGKVLLSTFFCVLNIQAQDLIFY